jgi:hypothetical protein
LYENGTSCIRFYLYEKKILQLEPQHKNHIFIQLEPQHNKHIFIQLEPQGFFRMKIC